MPAGATQSKNYHTCLHINPGTVHCSTASSDTNIGGEIHLDAVAVVVPLNMFEQVEVFSFQVRASAGTEYVIAVHCDTSSGSASP
jgi:hypothetical protein